MKKIIFTIALLFCLSMAWSQKLTEKHIQGKWQLINYTVIGASLDVTTGIVTVDPSAYAFSKESGEQLKHNMESYTSALKTATVEINGNNFSQEISDSMKVGTFTLENEQGHDIINGTFDDGTKGAIRVSLQDGNLVLVYPKISKKYTYKKVK